ncbi:hypothetical protein [Myxococcus stipitatus]|uniref:hypothetical protein n=1 Tax=Myxococcus stipitatus TaxID=83455 RepID=UPI0030D1AD2D
MHENSDTWGPRLVSVSLAGAVSDYLQRLQELHQRVEDATREVNHLQQQAGCSLFTTV